jgi:hypothetical protein
MHVNTIFKTECKKFYGLDDKDLGKLDHCCKWVARYRNHITFFLRRDVKSLVLLKNGTLSPKPISRTNKAYEKRVVQLEKALIALASKEDLRNLAVCQNFLKNGEGGIRNLVTTLRHYDAFMLFIKERLPHHIPDHVYMPYLTRYGRDPETTEKLLVEESTRLLQKETRRDDLIAALSTHNLSLREDSKLCQMYIDQGVHDLDYVVHTMRQMRYLYENTDYPKIVRGMLDRAYEDARQNIRWDHGYISDPDEYEELLHGYVDRDTIIEKAKVKAIRHQRNLPEYMTRCV